MTDDTILEIQFRLADVETEIGALKRFAATITGCFCALAVLDAALIMALVMP